MGTVARGTQNIHLSFRTLRKNPRLDVGREYVGCDALIKEVTKPKGEWMLGASLKLKSTHCFPCQR